MRPCLKCLPVTLLLLASLLQPAAALAQDGATSYPTMAPVEQYRMDRTAEIALARRAAPASISGNATILVLGKTGYETASEGTNGFVCMVDRGWDGPLDWPEFWNPKIRAAACLNPQAARSILPISRLRTTMALAGRSREEIVAVLKFAFEHAELPKLEHGEMAYMMAHDAYLTDLGGHNGAHVMFYTDVSSGSDWGANVEGSPVLASPFWYFAPQADSGTNGLPPMVVFLVGTSTWSDGTPAM
ncbi:MAG TPA: hypothetical protein VFI42_17335 [Thermomicrobiaceae bacterium]|nr:hypothetical protein [Thermomicrobiaceae bacterium]